MLSTTFLLNCSSSAKPLLALKNRSLHIDVDKAVFYSTYNKCKSRYVVFSKCTLERIEYDFTDKSVRSNLKAMGFKLKVSR